MMKGFFDKYGGPMVIVSAIGSFVAVTGAYLASVIRGDKREIKRYKLIEEEHEAYMKTMTSFREDKEEA